MIASRGRLLAWLAFVGLFAGLQYVGRAAAGKPDPDVLYQYSSAIAGAIQYAVILGILLWIGKGLPKRELFGLRRPASWRRAAGLAVLVMVAVYVLSGIISQFADPGEEQGLTPDAWEPSKAGAYAANFVVVAAIGPVVEELTYRGEGYTLLARYGTAVAVGGTAVLFGLGHGLIVGLPILVVFGLGLAILRARTDSVYPGIALHALFNSIALIAAVTIET